MPLWLDHLLGAAVVTVGAILGLAMVAHATVMPFVGWFYVLGWLR